MLRSNFLVLLVCALFLLSTLICYNNIRDGQGISSEQQHNLCILIPFRNCEFELRVMAPALHNFLSKQSVPHHFLVLNQTDGLRFNRAALINVGWYEAVAQGCDYIVMHDVDIIPLNPVLNYRFPGQGVVRHISAGAYHPIKRYNYKKFIGGVLMLTVEDYKRVNGMSNKYWGWGLEDDEFYLRMKEAGLTDNIERPTNLTTDRTNTFKHIHGPERKRDYATIRNQKEMSRKRDRISGLDSVKYSITGREVQYIHDTPVNSIYIQLECDKNWTPYCEFPSQKKKQ